LFLSINGPIFSVLNATFPAGGPNGEGSETFSLPVPPPPTPTCTASQLQGSVSAPAISGTFSEVYVELTNVSSQACHMEGFPDFDLIDRAGISIVNAERGCTWAPSGWCPTMLDYLNLWAHHGTAFIYVAWQSSPGADQMCSESATALITPPDAFDHLALPLQVAVCGSPLRLGVGTVQYAR
jgi:hypothetical protein